MKIYVINGPNLNMLGIREPKLYGTADYGALVNAVEAHCRARGVECVIFQSNFEGAIVEKIQEAYYEGADGIVINPGAYTHTSIALLDALLSVKIPCVEVHISKVEEREDFRQVSYIRKACIATITGHGLDGYTEACEMLIGGKNES